MQGKKKVVRIGIHSIMYPRIAWCDRQLKDPQQRTRRRPDRLRDRRVHGQIARPAKDAVVVDFRFRGHQVDGARHVRAVVVFREGRARAVPHLALDLAGKTGVLFVDSGINHGHAHARAVVSLLSQGGAAREFDAEGQILLRNLGALGDGRANHLGGADFVLVGFGTEAAHDVGGGGVCCLLVCLELLPSFDYESRTVNRKRPKIQQAFVA